MLVARYLVEDNSFEFISFNPDLTENLVRVRSIFTKFVGAYRVTTMEEEVKFKEEVI